MTRGTLEVLLVGAKGLDDTDFLTNMDPYAILTCRTQEQRSSVASGQGADPEWNETFVFKISSDVSDLSIKIMDSDVGSNDDFVGEVTIPLEPVITEGSLPPAIYRVVKDQEYRGGIKLGLTFKPEHYHSEDYERETFGGWRESVRD
ncbi:calcium-dependent lipid-binding (CaLB domain) family protein [Wolffia australiana]